MNSNWILLVVVLLSSTLAWFAGRQGAQSLLDSEQALSKLAPLVVQDPNFGIAVQDSAVVSSQVDKVLVEQISNGELTQRLLGEPLMAIRLNDAMSYAMQSDAGKKVVQSVVDNQLAASPLLKAVKPVSNSAANVSELKRIQTSMRRYESQLAKLSKDVKDDESAAVVNAMQGQLFELQSALNGLSKEVRCVVAGAAGTRSFLLKERRTTRLAGVELVMTLGRLRKGVLDSVSVSGFGGGQSSSSVKGNVSIGKPFDFEVNGRGYEGTFTYSQGRWGPDFVGFELRESVLGGVEADCSS